MSHARPCAGHPRLCRLTRSKTWMAGTSPAMTILRNIAPTQAVAMATTDTPSVADRARPIATGAGVVGACFLGSTAVFVLGDEVLLFVAGSGDPHRVVVHGGGILAAASDGERIVTGGDDGKVVGTKVDMAPATIAADPQHRWIDHGALAPGGSVAWSAGKDAFAQSRTGDPRNREPP